MDNIQPILTTEDHLMEIDEQVATILDYLPSKEQTALKNFLKRKGKDILKTQKEDMKQLIKENKNFSWRNDLLERDQKTNEEESLLNALKTYISKQRPPNE